MSDCKQFNLSHSVHFHRLRYTSRQTFVMVTLLHFYDFFNKMRIKTILFYKAWNKKNHISGSHFGPVGEKKRFFTVKVRTGYINRRLFTETLKLMSRWDNIGGAQKWQATNTKLKLIRTYPSVNHKNWKTE